jgi:teichuronic acid biosynthesis glycosyltransferase TuaG
VLLPPGRGAQGCDALRARSQEPDSELGVRRTKGGLLMPRVTAVMAVFNGAEHVSAAIASIQSQTMADWELIIVDDASTDSTHQVIAPFLADERIRYERLESNQGSGVARNLALRKATAPLIAPVDADDVSLPERFELEATVLDSSPDLVAVSGQMLWFSEHWGPPEQRVRFPVTAPHIRAGFQRGAMVIAHPASMFRTDAALRVGGYDEACRRAQDFGLMIKLSDRPMCGLDRVLILYRSDKRVSLRYVYDSDRYGWLAKARNRPGHCSSPSPSRPPVGLRGFAIGAGACLKWVRSMVGPSLDSPRLQRRSRRVSVGA